MQSGEELNLLTEHAGGINSISFSPDGQILFDGFRLWDVSMWAVKHTLTGHADRGISVSFSPDGQTIASGGREGTRILSACDFECVGAAGCAAV